MSTISHSSLRNALLHDDIYKVGNANVEKLFVFVERWRDAGQLATTLLTSVAKPKKKFHPNLSHSF